MTSDLFTVVWPVGLHNERLLETDYRCLLLVAWYLKGTPSELAWERKLVISYLVLSARSTTQDYTKAEGDFRKDI